MMASDRSPPPAPPVERAAAAPRPTHGTLPDSPFLHGFDRLLAVLVIALGFALASFAVRNSDFWRHLATGRLLAEAKFQFGSDPFSYSTGDRVWVNHAWLSDLAGYTIYRSFGPQSIVVVKALLLAGLVIVLFNIRRPGMSLWPYAVAIALSLFVMAAWMILTPALVSYFWLGCLLLLLGRRPARAGSWRLPLGVGLLCCAWANTDQWFFLGPLVIALYLVGSLIDARLRPTEVRPDSRTLAVALVVAVLACNVGPHHFRVWTLPAELTGGAAFTELRNDPAFASAFHSAFGDPMIDFNGSSNGNPATAWGLLLLVVLLLASFALNWWQASFGLMLVNAVLLTLGLLHSRALPFFAIAAGPTAALNLAECVQRLRASTWSMRTLQLLAIGRVGIRMALLLMLLLALAICYPGWLHAPVLQQRLAWEIEPDASLVEAAETLQRWRADGQLPADAHGLALSVELANYCCWFAPDEKNYFDGRLGFHAPEAATFARLHRYFNPADARSAVEFDLPAFLTEQRITHLTSALTLTAERQFQFSTFIQARTGTAPTWDLWAIAGRASVFGWRAQQVLPAANYQQMSFDPFRLAFDRGVEPLPDAPLRMPPPPRGFVEKYLVPLPTRPAAADASMLLHLLEEYVKLPLQQLARRNEIVNAVRPFALGAVTARLNLNTNFTYPAAVRPIALMSVRSARRAIIESPDHPAGYLALVQGYMSSSFDSAFPQYRQFVATATLERYFLRASIEQQFRDGMPAYIAARTLAELHFPRNLQTLPIAEIRRQMQEGVEVRLDLALVAMRRAQAIRSTMPQLEKDEQSRNDIKYMDAFIKRWDEEVRNEENRWRNNVGRNPSPLVRADEAIRNHWLPLRALDELKKADLDDASKLNVESRLSGRLLMSRLYLLSGQAELAELELQAIDKLSDETPDLGAKEEMRGLLDAYRQARTVTALVLGQYSVAVQIGLRALGEHQYQLEQTRRNELPKAAALVAFRRLALAQGGALNEVMAVTSEPLVNQEIRRMLQKGFQGSLYAIPNYAEEVLRNYDRQVEIEAEYHLQLGLLYLEQGDNRNATVHFRHVMRGLPAANRGRAWQIATFYLNFLQPLQPKRLGEG